MSKWIYGPPLLGSSIQLSRFNIRDIERGEEIFVNYDYTDDDSTAEEIRWYFRQKLEAEEEEKQMRNIDKQRVPVDEL